MTQQKPPRIGKEYLERNDVIFHPATFEDAEKLQRRLFDMGFRWVDFPHPLPTHQAETIDRGLVVFKGKMYYLGDADTNRYERCSVEQVMEDYDDGAPLPPEDMRAKFNELSQKVDRLTVLLEKLCDEVLPKGVDKPGLK